MLYKSAGITLSCEAIRLAERPPELLEFLHRYNPAVQSLALGLRSVVAEELAPCHEYIFTMRSKVVLLYGPTEHLIRDGICHIAIYPRHVLLAFPRGADLDDTRSVLRGKGKGMRHIRLERLSELDSPEIRQYIRRARRNAGIRRARTQVAREFTTRVKAARGASGNWLIE